MGKSQTDDELLDDLGLGDGPGAASWTFLVLAAAAWGGYAWFAFAEHAAFGGGAGGYVRKFGAAAPFLLGLLAVLLHRADGVFAAGLKRDYVVTLAPFLGFVFSLIFAARAAAGIFGGGSTVYNFGERVEHHPTSHDAGAKDRVFGVILYLVTAAGLPLAYILGFHAAGVDLIGEIMSDFQ